MKSATEDQGKSSVSGVVERESSTRPSRGTQRSVGNDGLAPRPGVISQDEAHGPDSGRLVGAFLAEAVAGPGPVRFSLRHPLRLSRVIAAVRGLPVLTADPSDRPDGQALRAGLLRGSRLTRALVGGLTAVIVLPSSVADYEAGGSKRSLRRGVAAARRAGVTCALIGPGHEREELLATANRFERSHPRAEYRSADPDNRDLLALSLWFAAYSADGRLLALAVAGLDGPWVALRYLRITSSDPDSTSARDLVVRTLVEEAVGLGASWVATDTSPIRLESGLRIAQQRMGFSLVRVRVARHHHRRDAVTASSTADARLESVEGSGGGWR